MNNLFELLWLTLTRMRFDLWLQISQDYQVPMRNLPMSTNKPDIKDAAVDMVRHTHTQIRLHRRSIAA